MNILVVEESQEALDLLSNRLKEWGHNLYTAKDGTDAWDMLKSIPVDIVVSDWIMSERDGLELCRRIRSTDFKRYIYIILSTTRDIEEEIVEGLEAGADDYITKPINIEELKARIEIGIRTVNLERELKRRYDEIKKNYYQAIRVFTNLIEVFDKTLGGHSRRVAQLSLKIAKHIPEITDHDLEVLEAAALLHDIGMIGLPNEILLKSRIEMTGEERELFLSHPVRGELILKEVEFLQPISKLIRAHHEQFNGKGFPDSIPGEEIPLLAKIISAASIYDNLLNRGKVPLSKIPESMERLRGYQLDPVMVDHILRINLEKIQEEKGRAFIEIDVCDLKEGMTLASDVRMRKGALVMPADTKLTGHDIEKLLSYWKLDCINDQIRIYKSTGIH